MKYITTDQIPVLLAELSSQGPVWAPQELDDSGETVLFAPWRDDAQVELERFSSVSPKELVLPASEKLFAFSYDSTVDGEKLELRGALPEDSDLILFGARACDARSMTVLDALFGLEPGEAYNDPHYKARRRNFTVITLACTTCDAACFCSSWEEGPATTEGSDLLLYPVDGGYLAKAVTEKGEQILGLGVWDESDQELPELAVTDKVPLEDLQGKLLDIFSDLDFWDKVTARCVSCGYCTYACPTCYCFNIFDEMRSDRDGDRCRGWDACMFYMYTLETSGHNPRPTKAHRYRNRISHKFSYYPENQGTILCTGCGRCIRGCPVSLDIRQVLRAAGEHS